MSTRNAAVSVKYPQISDCSVNELSSRIKISDENLGRGRFGCVFKATDICTSDEYAVKLLDIDIPDEKLIIRELEILDMFSKSPSPNVVMYYGHWFEKDNSKLPKDYLNQCRPITTVCLLMEVCDTSLQDWYISQIQEEKSLLPKAAKYFHEVVEGTVALHEKHIAHRDIKPANILIKDGIAKISDFGLSRLIRPDSNSVLSHGVGTEWYMSPQQRAKSGDEYTHKTDVYALGQILLEIYCPMNTSEIVGGKVSNDCRARIDSDKQLASLFRYHPKIALMVSYMRREKEEDRMEVKKLRKLVQWHVFPGTSENMSEEPIIEIKMKMKLKLSAYEFDILRFLEYNNLVRVLLSNVLIVPHELLAGLDCQKSLRDIEITDVFLTGPFDPGHKLYTPKLKVFKIFCSFLNHAHQQVGSVSALIFCVIERKSQEINYLMRSLDELHVVFNGIEFINASKSKNTLSLNLTDDLDFAKHMSLMAGRRILHHLNLRGNNKKIEISPVISYMTNLTTLCLNQIRITNMHLGKLLSVERITIQFSEFTPIKLSWFPRKSLKHLELCNAVILSEPNPKPPNLCSLRLQNCDISGIINQFHEIFSYEELMIAFFQPNLLRNVFNKLLAVEKAKGVVALSSLEEIMHLVPEFKENLPSSQQTNPIQQLGVIILMKNENNIWDKEIFTENNISGVIPSLNKLTHLYPQAFDVANHQLQGSLVDFQMANQVFTLPIFPGQNIQVNIGLGHQ